MELNRARKNGEGEQRWRTGKENGDGEWAKRTGKENGEGERRGEWGRRTGRKNLDRDGRGRISTFQSPPSPILVYYVDPVKREGWGLSYWPSCKVSAS